MKFIKKILEKLELQLRFFSLTIKNDEYGHQIKHFEISPFFIRNSRHEKVLGIGVFNLTIKQNIVYFHLFAIKNKKNSTSINFFNFEISIDFGDRKNFKLSITPEIYLTHI